MQRTWFRTSAIKFLCFILTLLFAASCSSLKPDIIQVGPWFAPKPIKQVEIFSSKEETTQPWGAIAIIHSAKIPVEYKRTIARQKKMALEMSANIGADGVVITEETIMPEPGIGISQGAESYISALAFKYMVNASTVAPASK